jgi:TetR/AcrR family transcriptional regulator, transcriptional repressor for nem operon
MDMTGKVAAGEDKRSRLTRAAAELTYARGFGKVALADIAEAADVPLGGVYYYFKTKTEIGEAIAAQRGEEFLQLRAMWEQAKTPKERLKAFVQSTVNKREFLVRSGCPVGSLCSELGKEDTPLAKNAARPLRELLSWIESQFAAMGHKRDKAGLAMHLLAAMQGVSLLANCFRDSKLVVEEGKRLNAWIDTL